jgi:hypothetical protein
MTLTTHVKERLYHDYYPIDVFLFLTIEVFAIEVCGCLHQQPDNFFFMNVLPWRGQQRVPEAFHYWCCVPFINRECRWHYRECRWHYREYRPPPSPDGLLMQERVCLDLEFYGVYLPSLYLICFMRVENEFSSKLMVCFILKYILKNQSEYESLNLFFVFSRIGSVLLNFVKNRNSQFSSKSDTCPTMVLTLDFGAMYVRLLQFL